MRKCANKNSAITPANVPKVAVICVVFMLPERRGSVMVSTFACHAADPGSIPGPSM